MKKILSPSPASNLQPQTVPTPHDIPPLLRLPEVLRIVPVSKATLYGWIQQGKFPSPVKIGPRAVAWRHADIQALTK